MKHFLFVILFFVLFSSCNKEEMETPFYLLEMIEPVSTEFNFRNHEFHLDSGIHFSFTSLPEYYIKSVDVEIFRYVSDFPGAIDNTRESYYFESFKTEKISPNVQVDVEDIKDLNPTSGLVKTENGLEYYEIDEIEIIFYLRNKKFVRHNIPIRLVM